MRKRMTLIGLLCFCCVSMATTLESLRVTTSAGNTSIICTFNEPVPHKVFMLRNPERLVLDFGLVSVSFNASRVPLGNSIIGGLRSGHPTPQSVRLVFDLKKTASFHTTESRLNHQYLLRIDMQHEAQQMSAASFVRTNTAMTPVRIKHRPPATLRDVVIVLDPGHGGKDPGAIGPRRSAEKQVVLNIAIKLKELINKQPGMRAVLTRQGDYYVGLRERLNMARKYNADVFVSIHADAFINHQSSGASVFALSQTGATSEAARWLAEKENYSELGGVNLSDLDDQNGIIRTVLIDLSQTATIGAGLQMGSRVLQHLDKITNLHNNNVEQARFVVLKSPDIPSILIETGFITNPREESNLTSSSYQARLTQAIFAGIKNYFWDYPPHGTRIEAMSGAGLHVVRRGETLPQIATRYHTSVNAIKIANRLTQTQLYPGQKLSISASWA